MNILPVCVGLLLLWSSPILTVGSPCRDIHQMMNACFDPPTVPYSTSSGWIKIFGGINHDDGWCVDQTTDGGYIVTGVTASYQLPPNGSTSDKMWLIKTDNTGEKVWETAFGGRYGEQGTSVQQTTDDGYIITGDTYSFGSGCSDIWLVKTDRSGKEMWNTTFGTTGWEYASCVQQTSEGGYIIVGVGNYTDPEFVGDVWLIKTDGLGNELWNKTYGGSNDESARLVQQTMDGGYIIIGATRSYGAGAKDAWLIKTDNLGNELWNKTFGGISDDSGNAVDQTTDGGYIITGATGSFGAGNESVWLIKTDGIGNKLWEKTFGETNYNGGFSIQQTTDQGYIIAGYTKSWAPGDGDAWLIKTDANGVESWNKTFGWASHDASYYVQQTTDEGYIMTGYTFSSYGGGEGDLWLIKTDHQWVVTNPPATPTIIGTTNGTIRTSYEYTISGTDPDHDHLRYYVDWGDYESTLTDFNESGISVVLSHKWNSEHNYTIRVKAIDENFAESDWASLIVVIPCSLTLIRSCLEGYKQDSIGNAVLEKNNTPSTASVHEDFVLLFGFIHVNGVVAYVEKPCDYYWFQCYPIQRITVFGIGLTGGYYNPRFKFYINTFNDATMVLGYSPKILFVSEQSQQFSFFVLNPVFPVGVEFS